MTPLDRLWYTVVLAHGGHTLKGGREEIDLTRSPALGRGKRYWVDYMTALVQLVRKAAHGRSGIGLEYNRFLSRRAP